MPRSNRKGFSGVYLLLVVAIVVVLALAGYWLYTKSTGKSMNLPNYSKPSSSSEDGSSTTTTDLDAEVNSIDLGDVDSDFKEVEDLEKGL